MKYLPQVEGIKRVILIPGRKIVGRALDPSHDSLRGKLISNQILNQCSMDPTKCECR